MITRQTSLSANIVQFCRFLRQKGFLLSVEEEATALLALQYIDYSNSTVFRLALKAIFCRNRSQLHDFDALFDEYWKALGLAIESKIRTSAQPILKPRAKDDSFKALKFWINGKNNEETEETAFYSLHENLSHKDFSSVPDDELEELIQRIKAVSKRLASHINRRYEKAHKMNFPDLRRTLRKNMRSGGELLELAFRKPKHKRTKLVLLCDVSKSMNLYTAFMLQFMYAFQQVYSRIETFTFSTSLQCITGILKQNDFSEALRLLGAQNNNWSGGTKIGESLHRFVQENASRVLNKRTIVIILSDGWDTGNITMLEQNMEIIHNKSRKLIWLNPLAGYADYRPDVTGMQAALPYIDIFASVHNIDSLRKLGKWL